MTKQQAHGKGATVVNHPTMDAYQIRQTITQSEALMEEALGTAAGIALSVLKFMDNNLDYSSGLDRKRFEQVSKGIPDA